jgi:hypothetical protein
MSTAIANAAYCLNSKLFSERHCDKPSQAKKQSLPSSPSLRSAFPGGEAISAIANAAYCLNSKLFSERHCDKPSQAKKQSLPSSPSLRSAFPGGEAISPLFPVIAIRLPRWRSNLSPLPRHCDPPSQVEKQSVFERLLFSPNNS